MKNRKKNIILKMLLGLPLIALIACSSETGASIDEEVTDAPEEVTDAPDEVTDAPQEKEIIRVAHNQPESHPTHQGMLEFEEFIESELGDKYDVQLYPSELLGTQTDLVQLTQTGAVEFTVASNSIMETFNEEFLIFNLPYLFDSSEVYHEVMNDSEIIEPIFNATAESGIVTVGWLDAGERSFYTANTPIEEPSDMEGLKIRVQQSPTNVRMMELLGASATPMGFGDVYTSIQAGVIDGAENAAMALIANGHGDVAKQFSYTEHQMIPDLVVGNVNFLENLNEEEEQIFTEGFEVMQDEQNEEWDTQMEEVTETAATEQGVEYSYPDKELFEEAVQPLHSEFLEEYPESEELYNLIQEMNESANSETDGDEE